MLSIISVRWKTWCALPLPAFLYENTGARLHLRWEVNTFSVLSLVCHEPANPPLLFLLVSWWEGPPRFPIPFSFPQCRCPFFLQWQFFFTSPTSCMKGCGSCCLLLFCFISYKNTRVLLGDLDNKRHLPLRFSLAPFWFLSAWQSAPFSVPSPVYTPETETCFLLVGLVVPLRRARFGSLLSAHVLKGGRRVLLAWLFRSNEGSLQFFR